jgi:lytic murein transglycosylase
MNRRDPRPSLATTTRLVTMTRRHWLTGAMATAGLLMFGGDALAQTPAFRQWVDKFRPRAIRRGISEATYDRVMGTLKPDTSVYAQYRKQPEFTETMWQYINRRCSGFRIQAGQERAREYASLLGRIERDYGVDRFIMLGLWGMESSFGDVIDNPKYMRPVIPALAALAYGEPRRRKYWEAELLNALVIVDRGWATPQQMIGSWAGAMGHTQWMPEVWLNIGIDYNKDGRVNPFQVGDAFAGTAHYLVSRGRYRRGESWGCEVTLNGASARLADNRTWRSYRQWRDLGLARADGNAFDRLDDRVRLWLPQAGGPAFLVGQNFFAVRSYNPSSNYTLALVHLGDLIRGDPPFRQQFPGGERAPTLAEMQELQKRLTARGFDTQGTDGRVGSDTMKAIKTFQEKVGMEPADGYAGLKVLARLRQMR